MPSGCKPDQGRWTPLLAAATAALLAAGCDERVVDAVRTAAAEDGGAGPALRTSCADVLAADPRAPDGVYVVDPDGPGGQPPAQVFCDMTTRGGGWTRLVHEDFTAPPAGFSRATITQCGAWGSILGGYRTFGSETVSATFDLRGMPHAQLRVRFDFLALDSWDGEQAFAELDGLRFWQVRCDKSNPATCNHRTDECGWDGLDRLDGRVEVDAVVPHARASASLSVGAVLDQSKSDESWGIDNLAVYVR